MSDFEDFINGAVMDCVEGSAPGGMHALLTFPWQRFATGFKLTDELWSAEELVLVAMHVLKKPEGPLLEGDVYAGEPDIDEVGRQWTEVLVEGSVGACPWPYNVRVFRMHKNYINRQRRREAVGADAGEALVHFQLRTEEDAKQIQAALVTAMGG